VSHFATSKVGNISHHIFKMDHGRTALCYKISWLCEARRELYWNKRSFAWKDKV